MVETGGAAGLNRELQMQKFRRIARHAALVLLLAVPVAARAELQPEPIPNVVTLSVPYPDTYAVVHDFAFGSLIDSSFSLVDVETRRFKGMLSAGQFATLNHSVTRAEFYVGETIHTRGVRGERQDLVAVYDFANLALQAEIELPPRRANTVINLGNSAVTADDRFLLIWNQNPGTSVTVIDLDGRTVASEIPTPGCALVYPDEVGGFVMLCGNGKLLAVTLDEAGAEASRWSSGAFNDIDNDPLSEKAARVAGVWHFVSYGGEVQPVDVSAGPPRVLGRWWLTSAAERAANWRPAGWHWTAGHDSGRLWVGMTPEGYEGSHKDPAPEVWLFDTGSGERLARFELRVPGLSFGATRGKEPKLLAVNVAGQLDIYDGSTGEWLRTVGSLGETPYMVHALP